MAFFSKPLLVIRPIKLFETINLYLSRAGKNNSAQRERILSISFHCPLITLSVGQSTHTERSAFAERHPVRRALPEYESPVRFDPKDWNNLLLGPTYKLLRIICLPKALLRNSQDGLEGKEGSQRPT